MKKIILENSQTTANQANSTDYSNELINREPIEGTPFQLIKLENGFFLTMGNYRITEIYNTKEETLELINTQKLNWYTLLTIINTMIEYNKKIK